MNDEKNLLTEDIDFDNLVVVQPKIEYKIVMTSRSLLDTEDQLNHMATEGWRVVAATDHLIYMEKRTLINLKGKINEG